MVPALRTIFVWRDFKDPIPSRRVCAAPRGLHTISVWRDFKDHDNNRAKSLKSQPRSKPHQAFEIAAIKGTAGFNMALDLHIFEIATTV